MWNESWKTDTGSIWIRFKVQCTQDVRIGLLSSDYNVMPLRVSSTDTVSMYEIVIGNLHNSQTLIRTSPGIPEDGISSTDSGSCEVGVYKPMWLSYRADTGELSVGTRINIGKNILLEEDMKDTEYHWTVRYFSITTGDDQAKISYLTFGDYSCSLVQTKFSFFLQNVDSMLLGTCICK